MINENRCCGIVAGWPKELSGIAGSQCLKIRSFLEIIKQDANIETPITVWNEQFTTQKSRDALSQTHRRRRTKVLKEDKVAATLILQVIYIYSMKFFSRKTFKY